MNAPVTHCLHCHESLTEYRPGEPMQAEYGTHGFCSLLHVVGHDVGLCGCTGYEGLTQRAAAIECQRRYSQERRHEPN